MDAEPGQCSLQAGAVVDNYAREVPSVQTTSRRGRLPEAPTCQSGPPTLLAVVASGCGRQCLDSRWLPERLRPQPDPRGPRLRRPDRARSSTATLAAADDRRRRHRRRARRQRVRRDVRRARATSAPCPPPCTTDCGTPRPPATRRPARRAASPTLAAMADLRAGNYSTALVVGVELEKTVPGDTAAQHLGAAAWTGHEGADAKFMWPYMFSEVADEYDRRYGLDEAHLRAIAALNFANARRNPNAQTRDWEVPDLAAHGGDDQANPRRRGPDPPLRLQPDDRRRRRASSWSPTTTCATTPGVRPIGAHRRLGTPHRRPGPAPETRPRRRRSLRHAARARQPCTTRSAARR